MNIYKDPDVARKIKISLESRKAAISKEYLCMLPSCNQPAINSHVIQRSQFLEPISDANLKLMSLETVNRFPGKLPRFRRTPIRNILTFKGFCSYHDQMIFSEIEKQDFDLTNPRHLALFQYRGICHEKNKKEIIINMTKGLMKHPDEFTPELMERAEQQIDLQQLGIKDIEFYKEKIEGEIINGQSNYNFIVEKLERREIVTSGSFTLENLIGEDPAKLHDEKWRNEPLKSVSVTMFPKDDELVMILGYLKEHEDVVQKFIKEKGGISLAFANMILIEYSETWACSETFYNEYIKDQEEVVKKACAGAGVLVPTGLIPIPNIMQK